MTTIYRVLWISPRGFCNEGRYYYGPQAEIDQLLGRYEGNSNSREVVFSIKHRSLESAKKAALKRELADRRRHSQWSEDAIFDVISTTDALADYKISDAEWDAIDAKYGDA